MELMVSPVTGLLRSVEVRGDEMSRRYEVADLSELQRQSGWPWSHRWNWLLDTPERISVLRRSVVAAALVFNGVIVGVFRLIPVWGPPDTALGWGFSVVGVGLLPIGVAWAWSAYRLRHLQARCLPGGV